MSPLNIGKEGWRQSISAASESYRLVWTLGQNSKGTAKLKEKNELEDRLRDMNRPHLYGIDKLNMVDHLLKLEMDAYHQLLQVSGIEEVFEFLRKNNISHIDCIGYFVALENNVKFLTGEKHFRHLSNVEFVQ